MRERVGFIGLGEMGKPMAKRLLHCGYQVTVCGHSRRGPVEEVKEAGAREVGSPQEVASHSDVAITMVRDAAQTESVVLGAEGVLEGALEGSAIIVMSTVGPDLCRRIGMKGGEKGVEVIDAAVSGASIGAERGTLAIMAGGRKDVVERYRPLLETMGKVIYCGDVGAGQVAKLANNLVLYVNLFACQEAVALAVANGVSEETVTEVMRLGTGNNWVIQNWHFANPKGRIGPGHWAVPLKDMDMAVGIAGGAGRSVPISKLVRYIIESLERVDESGTEPVSSDSAQAALGGNS